MIRRLVVVTGAPASGKSTIAVPLAQGLSFPLIAKDVIKEALGDAVPMLPDPSTATRVFPNEETGPTLAWSGMLGAATYTLMWELAPKYDRLVLESNFHPRDERHRGMLATLGEPVEVFCHCPPQEAQRRYRDRACSRHPVHVRKDLPLETFAVYAEPLALGPVLPVDTTKPTDMDAIVHWVRKQLGLP